MRPARPLHAPGAETLRRLEALYRLFEAFLPQEPMACRPGCDTCCTRNVTITTLEGWFLLRSSDAPEAESKREALRRAASLPRYRPSVTINALAALCAAGDPAPEEEDPDPGAGGCPLLTEGLCAVYPVRPFGCRCMMSRRRCADTGYADMGEFPVTVGTVFQQVIEHLDAGGCTGNLIDVLRVLTGDAGPDPSAAPADCRAAGLLPNRPVPILMVPPEHRERIAPLLARVRNLGL